MGRQFEHITRGRHPVGSQPIILAVLSQKLHEIEKNGSRVDPSIPHVFPNVVEDSGISIEGDDHLGGGDNLILLHQL